MTSQASQLAVHTARVQGAAMRLLFSLAALALVVSTAAASGASGRTGLTFTRLVPATGRESVWMAAADGSYAREVTAHGLDGALSPDGRWLTFVREGATAAPDFELLFLVDLTTGKIRPLGESNGDERWAPVGARLAVTQPRGFFLIDAASGKRTRLLTAPVSSFDFTPDGNAIVLARGKAGGWLSFERNDLFLLRLSSHTLVQLTKDGRSQSPLASRTGIAYVRTNEAKQAYEVWWMRMDGNGRRLVARCCESKWYRTHAGTAHGFSPVALSADGRHLLTCQPSEGACEPVAISLPSGRRYSFLEIKKFQTRTESADGLDLTRDGRTALILIHPWAIVSDTPGRRLLYAVPFTGGPPKLLAQHHVVWASWRA
jgi:Tol biopolymer transport system component